MKRTKPRWICLKSGSVILGNANCRAYSVLLFVLKFPIDCDIIISSINLFLLVNRGNYE